MEPGHERIRNDEAPQKRRFFVSVLLAALLAAAVLLPRLGHRPLTDWDEGIYAEIAREMLAAHSPQAWLVPHWNGQLWFEKPPLQMWLTAASLRIFGLNAFAARLPSALAGVGSVALLHAWLLGRTYRAQAALTAWASTVLLLSAFGFQHVARVGETDTLLALFCLCGVLGLAELLKNNAQGWPLFWIGFALALLTKGAASITLPLTALVVAAVHPRRVLRHRRAFVAGLLLFFALTLPWHAYVFARFGKAFLHAYLGFHTLTRATTAIEGHHTQPWFYLWVLLLSAPPFALLYPLAVIAPFRNAASRLFAADAAAPAPPDAGAHPNFVSTEPGNIAVSENRRPRPMQAFAVFAVVTLVLFSAAGTRLPHYIAPAYPAFSALTAALLTTWLQQRGVPRTLRSALPLTAVAVFLYAAAAFLTARPRKALHSAQSTAGYVTPDNRESVTLLEEVQRASGSLPAGPLLVWRSTPVVPLTTDAFYARRPAIQVSLAPPPGGLPLSPYFNDPHPLGAELAVPRLVLLDCSLLGQLPLGITATSLVKGPTQEVAILQLRSSSR